MWSYTYSNIINTACYGPCICIARVSNNVLRAVYIDIAGREVVEDYSVTLPLDTSAHVAGMKQLSMYDFRILTGVVSSGMYNPVNVSTFYFYRVHVNTNHSVLESSYSFPSPTAYSYIWEVTTDFDSRSRNGDHIFGYQHIKKVYSPGYYRADGHILNGIVANIGDASFGTLIEMFNSGYACEIALGISHNGDEGFYIRMAVGTMNWTVGFPNPSYFYFYYYKLETFEWTGVDIAPAAVHYTLIHEESFDPYLFITYDAWWPPRYIGPRANANLSGRIANSFYFPALYSSSLRYHLGTHQEYLPTSLTYNQSGKSAYPYYCEDPIFIEDNASLPVTVSNWIYMETGHFITYTCGAIEAVTHNCYLVDRISKTFTQLVETGYDIKTIFSKLEQPNHYILCWAKRTADGMFGIMKFTDGGIFLGFVPVATSFYTEAYGAIAYFANGFIVVSNWCYYIGGPGHHNVVQMILEQN
jgi:hypothetical protein